MPTRRAAGGHSSSTRVAARLMAEFAAFAALLFVTRFVARGHLAPQIDQECHIGGIAVDVLAHGIRFPLLAYAPNEYDNGTLFSGLLAALSFAVFGRSVLALKLVTHFVSAAGAVATLWLLRGCLAELGLTARRVRWAATAALVIAIALAPRMVTMTSLYAIGNHPEGSAIDTILLALFACRLHTRTVARTAAFWMLVGFALYLNKGTLLVIPVLGAAELALAWRTPTRLMAGLGGLLLGALPELLVIAQRHGRGWASMASKAGKNSQAFPQGFVDSVMSLADDRVDLLAVWVVALAVGVALLVRSIRSGSWADLARGGAAAPRGAAPPVTLGLVVGVTGLHLAVLMVMAQGDLDSYAIYAYPGLVVLVSVLVALACATAEARWGENAGRWAGAAAIAVTLVLYRPDALAWRPATVTALGRNRAGAACFWRFAEGFEREQTYGLAAAGQTPEQHAIERCRSFAERDQVLDCIGGVARELHWRRGGAVPGAPPDELSGDERRAYAYYYGTHRNGESAVCSDFTSPALTADCVAAVQLECLIFGDMLTRYDSGHGIGRPQCDIGRPPMDGYWTAMRADLFARALGPGPTLAPVSADNDLKACKPLFDACY